MSSLTISVVINTYNRADSLRKTLDSFRRQTYHPFEIVVVNGPSTDKTRDVLENYASLVKIYDCPVTNISVSRNIGISHAAGEIVAFIDDDAIPYSNWLQNLADQYINDDIGGVGGFVWDLSGVSYQSRYIACNRFGDARYFDTYDPSDFFSFPNAMWYPSLVGVNSSFRKSALIDIGGFNEVYAYYLDETDVCLRIIDRGYKIVFAQNAKVHHKTVASSNRDTRGRIMNFYPAVTSKTNFVMTHGASANGRVEAEKRIRQWISEKRIEINVGYLFGDYSKNERTLAHRGISEAYSTALKNVGFWNVNFKPDFDTSLKSYPAFQKKLRIAIISADFPPNAEGGIGTFMKTLSAGLAKQGHEIHVITRALMPAVDFVGDTWVHRIRPHAYRTPCIVNGQPIDLPHSVRDWAGTAKERVEFISSEYGRVDVVISPVWNLEGSYTLASSEWQSVITLHTTYAMSVDTHPDWTRSKRYFNKFIKKMMDAEKAILESGTMLLANSEALVDAVHSVYGTRTDDLKLAIVPHGVPDFFKHDHSTRTSGTVRGLFVGRLELRKGADLLFDVLPDALELMPNLSFDVVGDNSIRVDGIRTLMDMYRESLAPYIKEGRLKFYGKVADEELESFYNACDFFVAPSRFESFGLILAEAMSCGKPVVACRAGGMVEVVGNAGLLAEPGDRATLKEHIITLASNAKLREDFGRAARSRFESLFSVDKMAQKISEILEGIAHDKQA